MGDVGGLFDCFRIIGYFIVPPVASFALKHQLLQKLSGDDKTSKKKRLLGFHDQRLDSTSESGSQQKITVKDGDESNLRRKICTTNMSKSGCAMLSFCLSICWCGPRSARHKRQLVKATKVFTRHTDLVRSMKRERR